MGARIKAARGKLAVRLHWTWSEGDRRVRYSSYEGTGLDDTESNRAVLERRFAQPIEREMDAETWTPARYLFYFPHGHRAAEFRTPQGTDTLFPTLHEQFEDWMKRRTNVRPALYRDRRLHLPKYVLGEIGHLRLDQITARVVDDLRATLRRQGLKESSVRSILGGSLRALLRDARAIDGIAIGDPFIALRNTWQTAVAERPDPFTREERDRIEAHFLARWPVLAPAIITLFRTGMRPSELAGLRWGDVDLVAGTLEIRRSRVLGHENLPKTARSRRVIAVLPQSQVIELLREAQPLHAGEALHVFRMPHSATLEQGTLRGRYFAPTLRALGIRPRKLYATRHTFISLALTDGLNPKFIADYCGTSMARIETNYGRWMGSDHNELAKLDAATRLPRCSVGRAK